MELTERDLHCVARLLQGAVYGERGNAFDGCAFCKYQCKTQKEPASRFDEVMYKLKQLTGVELGSSRSWARYFPHFPYERFLVNANDEIKTNVANYFSKGFSGAE